MSILALGCVAPFVVQRSFVRLAPQDLPALHILGLVKLFFAIGI